VANIFWIKNQMVHTPPLSEGGVAGVTRKFLLQKLPGAGYTVNEKELTVDDLLSADEIFLTNAVRGIRIVGKVRDQNYSSAITKEIRRLLMDEWT
jgi:branched-chain amino acid aminotransferase